MHLELSERIVNLESCSARNVEPEISEGLESCDQGQQVIESHVKQVEFGPENLQQNTARKVEKDNAASEEHESDLFADESLPANMCTGQEHEACSNVSLLANLLSTEQEENSPVCEDQAILHVESKVKQVNEKQKSAPRKRKLALLDYNDIVRSRSKHLSPKPPVDDEEAPEGSASAQSSMNNETPHRNLSHSTVNSRRETQVANSKSMSQVKKL